MGGRGESVAREEMDLELRIELLGRAQGHQDQFIAEMAQWGMPKDRKFKVGGRGMAQKTKGGFGFAEPCRDQRVHGLGNRPARTLIHLARPSIAPRTTLP